MTDANAFETIERHRKGDGSGHHEFRMTPDEYNPIYPAQAEFIYKASKALKKFRDKWIADHPQDTWAHGVEMDNIPVMTDGMVMGYLGVSEIDGESYDYFPAMAVENEVTE